MTNEPPHREPGPANLAGTLRGSGSVYGELSVAEVRRALDSLQVTMLGVIVSVALTVLFGIASVLPGLGVDAALSAGIGLVSCFASGMVVGCAFRAQRTREPLRRFAEWIVNT
jgi:hypothetical protein